MVEALDLDCHLNHSGPNPFGFLHGRWTHWRSLFLDFLLTSWTAPRVFSHPGTVDFGRTYRGYKAPGNRAPGTNSQTPSSQDGGSSWSNDCTCDRIIETVSCLLNSTRGSSIKRWVWSLHSPSSTGGELESVIVKSHCAYLSLYVFASPKLKGPRKNRRSFCLSQFKQKL